MIGYWLAQELRNAGVGRPVATIITQTVVDAADPAFAAPIKFIGAVYSREDAERLAVDRGWRIAADCAGWRRVVASTLPQRILEESAIRLLLDADTLVICGGVPVIQDSAGRLTGVEAVVDKDLTAAAIAVTMDADRMLLLTDVPAVMRDFGTADAVALDALTLSDVAELHLPAGSMGAKVVACARLTSVTGQPAGAVLDNGDAATDDQRVGVEQKADRALLQDPLRKR